MKKIILISLAFHMHVFCGSDEIKPLLQKSQDSVQKPQVSSEDFYDEIINNNARFFQENLKQLKLKNKINWIGLKTAAEANITSKQALVREASKSRFFKKKKSIKSQEELAHALAIKEIIMITARLQNQPQANN